MSTTTHMCLSVKGALSWPTGAQALRDQCLAANVPFFFKQWGEWLPGMQDGAMLPAGQLLNCSDAAEHVGTKAAGCKLDGLEWHQFPVATPASQGS